MALWGLESRSGLWEECKQQQSAGKGQAVSDGQGCGACQIFSDGTVE